MDEAAAVQAQAWRMNAGTGIAMILPLPSLNAPDMAIFYTADAKGYTD